MASDVLSADKLAMCMQELGYSCSSDEVAFNTVLRQCPDVDEQCVAEVLGMMAKTHAGLTGHVNLWAKKQLDQPGTWGSAANSSASDSGLTNWNFAVVVDGLKAAKPGLNWQRVAELLDYEGFVVPDASSFATLCAAYKRGAGEQIPVKAVVGRPWRNMQGQLSLLRQATAAPPDIFSFEACEQQVAAVEGLEGGRHPSGSPNQAWLCRDLLEVLAYLTDAGHFPAVRQILELPAKSCPEVLVLSAAAVPGEWGLMQREVFGALLPMFLSGGNPNSTLLFRRLWAMNQALVLEILIEYYSQDHTRIGRVLDICQELQALSVVLCSSPYPFSLELAVAASRRELLALDKWLEEQGGRDGPNLLPAIMRFVDAKTMVSPDGQALASKVAVPQEALHIMVRLLQQQMAGPSFPAELVPELQRVLGQAAKAFPALQPMITLGAGQFASDVEEEANNYFQLIYKQKKGVEEVLAVLQRFRASALPREQEVFACMIHNLLDEYRFFYRYPDKELHTTAVLFGQLVAQQIVSSVTLGLTLRYILDALKKPPGQKMFTFGLEALREFAPMLQHLPQLWPQLVQVPHLQEADPELYKRVEALLREQPASEQQQQGGASGPGSTPAAAAAAAAVPYLAMPVGPHGGTAEPRQLFAAAMEAGTAKEASKGAGQAWSEQAKEEGHSGMAPGFGPGPARPFGQLSGLPPPSPGGPSGTAAAAAAAAAGNNPAAGGPGGAGRRDSSIDASIDDKDGLLSLAAQVASSSLMPATGKDAPSLTALVNTESLESAAEKYQDFKEPPGLAMERIHFIMNNLSIVNLEAKLGDIKERVFPDYVPWFANYMVVRRAAQEANYHTLYISLCDKLGEKELYRLLVKTTLYYVKILLYSERTVKESNDRVLLKNLGVWLGLLTFAKNKPLLSKELELKQIVVEAYQRGRLIAVLPFMQKLLECCKDSKVFRPTNPMIAGILSLLAELHSLKGLKINNAFSIELVFKAFNLPAEDVKPTDLLRTLPRERQCNPDWGMDTLGEQENTTPLPGPEAVKASQASQLSSSPMQSSLAAVRSGLPPLGGAQGQDLKAASGGLADAAAAAAAAAQAAGLPLGPGGAAAGPGGLDSAAGVVGTLHPFITISPQLAAVAERLQLKRLVPAAVERAIVEILTPVVERSVTIACYTTVELLMKDFAMDPDEGRMRKAAHLMVSTLAGSLALVTCKDPLRVSLGNALKAQLQQPAAGLSPEALDSIVGLLAGDNLELGCSVIERAATEKAMRDVDKLLQPAYDERTKARLQGKTFTDTSSFHGRFPQSLPESLRPRPGQVHPQMLRVYEDFQRTPRSAPPTLPGAGGPGAMGPRPGTGGGDNGGGDKLSLHPAAADASHLERYLLWQGRADAAIHAKEAEGPGSDQSNLQQLLQELSMSVSDAGPSADDVASFYAKRLLKHLSEPSSKLHTTFYVACLEALSLGPGGRRLPEELSRLVADEEGGRGVAKEVVEMLVRARLLGLQELDTALAKQLAAGKELQQPSMLLLHLIKTCVLRDQALTYYDLAKSLDLLANLAARGPGNEAILQALDQARKASSLASVAVRPQGEILAVVRDKADPAGLRDQVIQLFEEWLRLLSSGPDDKAVTAYLVALRGQGLMDLDDTTDRFLRLMLELSASNALSNVEQQQQAAPARPEPVPLVPMALDALVRLVSVVVAKGGGEQFLSRFLAVLVGVVKRDADERGTAFNGRPFMRVLAGLMSDLGGSDAADASGIRYLKAIGLALYSLQPISVPGFAFAWLELTSHRFFMPKLLGAPLSQGCALYEALLVALLKFLEPYLRVADLSDSIRSLYKGALRLLLLLLHDFPEFLCEHHHTLCDAISTSCIQMRNLILSAFPRNMRLPDPFTPNLKVDLLPEISAAPRLSPEPERLLPEALRTTVDAFLRTRAPASLPQDLAKRLQLPPADAKVAGTAHNVPAINALVLYVGSTAKPGVSPVGSPAMELYLRLLAEMDSEARYLTINAVANQLRYPNSHTHYFSCVLLTLFADVKADSIKEQITRVLLERLIVNRPHPWGLLITFIELIKNPRYNFWSLEFTRCAPDIERLFKSVANSCMGPIKGEQMGAAAGEEAAAGVAGSAAGPKEAAVRG